MLSSWFPLLSSALGEQIWASWRSGKGWEETREKHPILMTGSSNFMFSFVSIAKPGKHFLIETDEEDGQPENGPVPNDYAGELLFYRTCCVSFSKWCDDSKVNIFVLQYKSFGNWDDLVSFLNKTITAVLGGSKAFRTMLKNCIVGRKGHHLGIFCCK